MQPCRTQRHNLLRADGAEFTIHEVRHSFVYARSQLTSARSQFSYCVCSSSVSRFFFGNAAKIIEERAKVSSC